MKKDTITTILLVLVLIIGLSLLLYPTVSDWWNTMHQSQAIIAYEKRVVEMDTDAYEKAIKEAEEYNETLLGRDVFRFRMTDLERTIYNGVLDISGTGMMGTIEIPAIKASMPIYHGTDEGTLATVVGHVEGSSLPVGGKGTHCVLSGHRGLPSARLFTDLDKVKEGDVFYIRVLNEVLTYEVDQILTVLPHEMDALAIDENEDYCTLVTCTPYGINTHRLLVRGHRVETDPALETLPVEEVAVQHGSRRVNAMDELTHLLIAILVLAAALSIGLIVLLVSDAKKRKR